MRSLVAFLLLYSSTLPALAQEAYPSPFKYADPKPQAYALSERASKIDPRVKSYEKINFLLELNKKPRDVELAYVDTRVKPRGKLVIALTAGAPLFKLTNELGMHAILVPYADSWFNVIKGGTPKETWRGDVRLEAATGDDVSKLIDLAKPDGLMERSFQFVKWLDKTNPQGKWDHFLTKKKDALRWEDVMVVGLSHGATTAARFAMHKKLDRVICFSGPLDPDQSWQAQPSATPANRYFVFSGHDDEWNNKHYCRSWEMLGLNKFGPIVDVDRTEAPYANTRCLVTSMAAKTKKILHNAVAPNDSAFKNSKGQYIHDPVWRYMFTHPVDTVGAAVPADPDCQKK